MLKLTIAIVGAVLLGACLAHPNMPSENDRFKHLAKQLGVDKKKLDSFLQAKGIGTAYIASTLQSQSNPPSTTLTLNTGAEIRISKDEWVAMALNYKPVLRKKSAQEESCTIL